MQVPTITVENKAAKNGYMVINKSDFDGEIHKEFTGDVAAPAADPEPENPFTREKIAAMKKADLAELIESHGFEAKGNKPQMVETLIEIMFIDDE